MRIRRRNERGEASSALIIIGSIVAVIALFLGVWAIRVALAPQIGEANKRINTNTGEYIETTYNKFYDECAAIQSNELRQALYQQQLVVAKKSGDQDAVQRAQINLDAVVATHADLVTQYNADSSKTGTEAQHKASDLPWNVSTTYNPEEPTKCAR